VAFLFEENPVSKEEIIGHIHKCAKKLGRTPNLGELLRAAGTTHYYVKKLCGSYERALAECGLNRKGHVSTVDLFADWARIVRKLNKIPSTIEYTLHSPYTISPLRNRFGHWKQVPLRLLVFAERHRMSGKWPDVLAKIRSYKDDMEAFQIPAPVLNIPPKRRKWKLLPGRPVYGEPLARIALANKPVNEAGVTYLFGVLAARLGFVVTRIHNEFPDCEAMRRVDDTCWQKVRIEFEYESRNFVKHKHDAAACDLIVCWNHNWQQCPLEVVELKGCIGC
jgi:hypothetical protein